MSNADQLAALRHEKDEFFKRHPQSPLTPAQQRDFVGLSYYDYNPGLDLTVPVEPFAEQGAVLMQTTTGDVQHYQRYGSFAFTVDGQEARLTIYRSEHGFFLPFADANAGTETYGAGRYLEPEYLGGDRFHIDLNHAYNPYCAYNEGWSCPVTPPENRVKVAVRAGEMVPQGAWTPHG